MLLNIHLEGEYMEEHAKKLQLNVEAVAHARKLIQEGKVDTQTSWEQGKPDAHAENRYLDDHSFDDFGKWFLGIASDTPDDVKEHYAFPYGNFEKVYRHGLIAAKQRAAQFGHTDIEQAAGMLLDMIGE